MKWQEATLLEEPKAGWQQAPVLDDAVFDDEQRAKMDNAMLYGSIGNQDPSELYDITDQINTEIYGQPGNQAAIQKSNQLIQKTKSWGQSIEHGLIVAGNQMNKTMKEAGWAVADIDQQFWKWVGVKQPEILKRWDEEAFELKRELDAYLELFYKENPDKLAEAAPQTGYLQKALWYTENPKVVLQHTIQSAPIMLLGGLGKVAGLGKAAMIALFGGPTAAETYTEARGEGTEITPAIAQSLLTGAGEGAIEEWTFGRKIGLAQNFSKIVKGGWPKVAWEALKAYGRGTAEEAGQQANRNFWQFIFTDGNQKISEGVADAAAAGGPVELLMAGVFGMGGYSINKGAELVDQAEQHRRLNIIDGEIQKSQNFTEEQKAEISQEIASVREDVDSGVYLPEEKKAETPAQAVGKAPSVPAAGQTGETGAVEPISTGVQFVPPAAAEQQAAIAYHGTSPKAAEQIQKKGFKPKILNGQYFGSGVYLTPSETEAKNYGEAVVQVSPNLKNPFILDMDKYDGSVEAWYDEIQDEIEVPLKDEYGTAITVHTLNLEGGKISKLKPDAIEAAQEITAYLQNKGYDGVIVKQKGQDDEIVVFNPEQVGVQPAAKAGPGAEGKPTIETSASKAVIFEGELFHGTDEVGARELLKGKPFKISTTSGGGEIEGADFGNGAYFVLQSGMTGPYGDIELKAKATKPLRLYEATTIEEKGFVTKNWRELAKQGFDGAVFRQGGITEGTEYENEIVIFQPKGKVQALYDTGQTEDENAYRAEQSFTQPAPAAEAQQAERQAWEMTREEYQTQARQKRAVQAAFKIGEEIVPTGSIHDFNKLTAEQQEKANKTGLSSGFMDEEGNFFTDKTSEISRRAHRDIVKQAVEEGKSVRRDIIEEYKHEDWAQKALGKGEREKAEAPVEPVAKPLEIETDLDKPELPSVTSARQAMIAEDRTALGLDEIASPERKAWKESLSKAKEKGHDENALRIASEVNINPRALDDEETAGLVIKAARLKNEYKGLMDKLSHTKDKGEIQGLAVQADRVEAEFDSLSKAIHVSGTEKGRALASQKLTINQDYNLISVVTRAKAAKGKELSTAERAKFSDLTGKLDEATAKIDDLQRQIAEMAASSGIRKQGLKRYNRMSLEQKDTQLNSLVSRVNELLKQGCY